MATTKPQDPSRTKTIRAEWSAEITRRFKRVRRRAVEAWLAGPPFGQVVNQTFDYTSDPAAIASFLAWLSELLDYEIFDNFVSPSEGFWQNSYLNRSYQRGVERARRDLLRALGETSTAQFLSGSQEDIQRFLDVQLYEATPENIFDRLRHFDAVRVLHTRDYSALRGVTNATQAQIARVLTDGVQQGQNTRVIGKAIADRVDKIGITRGRLIAQTETVRAYNVGSINEGLDFADDTGLEVKHLWQSAEDSRVRISHAEWNQTLMEEETALSRIGEPNCRCAVTPVIVDDLTPEDRKEFAQQRRAGLALVEGN